MLVALNKIRSYFLENQFRREASQFFEEFVNSISSTVAAISCWTKIRLVLPSHFDQ